MATLNFLLKKHFGKLVREDQEKIRKSCVQLLYRRITNKRFTDSVKIVTGQCPQAFKDDLLWAGSLIKDLKLFTTYAKKHRLEYEQALTHARKFNLAASDANLYLYSKRYAVPKYILAMTVKDYDKMLEQITREIDTFTKKFVYRKMRFIINSTNCEPTDLINELICRALQSVSYMYPFIDSYDHAVNIAKQTVHQRGINLILSNTTDKRKRMQNIGDKANLEFGNQVIPVLHESKLKMILGSEFNINNLSNGITGNHQDLDLKLDVDNILNKASGKKRIFIGLLLGEYDKEFTKYLFSKKAIPSDKTNQDLFDRKVRTVYVKHALKYSDLNPIRGKKILGTLRKKLIHYKY